MWNVKGARLVDCVGFMPVDGAAGHMWRDDEERLVKPWFEYEIPFTQAAGDRSGEGYQRSFHHLGIVPVRLLGEMEKRKLHTAGGETIKN